MNSNNIFENLQIDEQFKIASSSNFIKRLWSKDPYLWKDDPKHIENIKNSLGWLDIPYKMLSKIAEIEDFSLEIKKEGFKYIVLLGMGGSSLAPDVYSSIFQKKSFPKLFVLDSTHPETIWKIRQRINLNKTLFIFPSKSGGTIEPNTQFKYFWQELKKIKKSKPENNFIAITDKNTSLEKLAYQFNFRKIFINPSDIGGRFSALSYFGLVPAALCGADIDKILKRAINMADLCQLNEVNKNKGFELGLAIAKAFFEKKDKLTLILPKEINRFGLWIEQLIAESTGKEGKGIIPVREDLLKFENKYGNDRFFILFDINNKGNKDEIEFLKKNNFNFYISNINDFYDIGAEFFKWEIATATAGFFLKINPFDQPDVQESKKLTIEILKNIKENGKIEEVIPDFNSSELSIYASKNLKDIFTNNNEKEIFENFIKKAKPGDYISILAYIDENKENENALKKLSEYISLNTGISSIYSYGPRYLHSTGQLFKGGENKGLFLVLTGKSKKDIILSGENYSFYQLNIAQAIGDFKALESKERKVIRMHIKNKNINKYLKALSNKLVDKKKNPSPLMEEKMVKLAERKTTTKKITMTNNEYIVIDYPKNMETITSRHYTVRIGASNCVGVDISIDDQPWTPCRHSVGYWWYDWNNIQPGNHQIVARLNKGNGQYLISKRRRCKVV